MIHPLHDSFLASARKITVDYMPVRRGVPSVHDSWRGQHSASTMHDRSRIERISKQRLVLFKVRYHTHFFPMASPIRDTQIATETGTTLEVRYCTALRSFFCQLVHRRGLLILVFQKCSPTFQRLQPVTSTLFIQRASFPFSGSCVYIWTSSLSRIIIPAFRLLRFSREFGIQYNKSVPLDHSRKLSSDSSRATRRSAHLHVPMFERFGLQA